MAVCYLAVGANLGNRRRNILIAAQKINCLSGTKILKRSRLMTTRAQGGPKGQPNYLNGCFKMRTRLTPLELLKKLKRIERSLGRINNGRNQPRPIDLDILLYAAKVMASKELTIPHPRMFKREFVLKPLLEVL